MAQIEKKKKKHCGMTVEITLHGVNYIIIILNVKKKKRSATVYLGLMFFTS